MPVADGWRSRWSERRQTEVWMRAHDARSRSAPQRRAKFGAAGLPTDAFSHHRWEALLRVPSLRNRSEQKCAQRRTSIVQNQEAATPGKVGGKGRMR
ncbi:protein of unknown function [Microbacterium sp. Nx66]|nr:protein of unknown function [Microbacterium sp. Nx66]